MKRLQGNSDLVRAPRARAKALEQYRGLVRWPKGQRFHLCDLFRVSLRGAGLGVTRLFLKPARRRLGLEWVEGLAPFPRLREYCRTTIWTDRARGRNREFSGARRPA